MFKRIFDNFDDFDPERVMNAVNLVWNNRDRLIDLIERLPSLLAETGDGIASAGESAEKASLFLAGNGQRKGAGEISQIAARALDKCYDELQDAARLMANLGEEIDDIRIPSFRPKHTEVMGIRVVKGFDIGENSLVDNAADRLKGGADRLEEIGRDLRTVAENLRDMGGLLNETGGDLNNLGVKLRQSGKTLRSFSELGGSGGDDHASAGSSYVQEFN